MLALKFRANRFSRNVRVPRKLITLMLHYARYGMLPKRKGNVECPEEDCPLSSSIYRAVYSLHMLSVSKVGRRTTTGK
jgi:hypothetical protein